MKNLSSKLFGGLAVAALVVGSFSMTEAKAEVSIDEVTVEATQEMETANFASEWFITRNYVIVGNPTSTAN